MPHSYRDIPDWPKLRKRYVAYWKRKVPDRRILAHIQNPNPFQNTAEPWMLEGSEDKYLNPKKLFDLVSWRRTGWNWHTDLFKYRIASYGPNVFTGFCGGQVAFGPHTVWHEPVISSLDESDRIHFDETNRYWKIHLETVAHFSERCNGIEHFGVTDFGGPTDWISQLMGTENFLMAAIEQPDRMREFAIRLARECNRAYDLVHPLATRHNDGTVNWMPVWSDRRMGTAQDDMAINFSPAMYAEVFAPAIQAMASHTERTVLHWHDGCAHHLDTLLKIKEITLIQFGHDPNSPPFRDSLHHMRKIQAAGKLLFISCVEAEDVEFFVANLDPRGLLMIINTHDDEASRRMEDDVAKWTDRRMRNPRIP